jgi:small-conductance mechanosensitive channel
MSRAFAAGVHYSLRFAAISILCLIAFPCIASGNNTEGSEHSPNIRELLRLLQNAEVQDWLRKQESVASGVDEVKEAAARRAFGQAFSERFAAIRNHLGDLWRALPTIGAEFRQADYRLREASGGPGFLSILLAAGSLTGFGLAIQAMVRKRIQHNPFLIHQDGGSPGPRRRRRLARSIAGELVGLLVFCIACFGPPLLFEQPSLPDSILLTFLAASAAWVSTRSMAYVISASDNDRNIRLSANPSPTGKSANGHLFFWIIAAVGWFAFGSAIVETTRLSGMDPQISELVSYCLGLGLLMIGFAAIWRVPQTQPHERAANRNVPYRWLATFFLVVLWMVWVADAMRLFWLLAIGLLTPMALRAGRKLTRHLFLDDLASPEGENTSTTVVIADTLLRASLIAAALWILARAWGIGFSHLAASDDSLSMVARAVVTVLAILLVFDVLWQFTRTVIDLNLSRMDGAASPGSEIGIRQAKLRTLLPVARNFAMVLFATLAVMMSLSSLGIEIGPLIASAGVVGLAIGFGAQTLVKDVISGIFYLLDDAFRVGEYIVSGSFSGTVESFSLRSVRLRHNRGPVFTVPFSALGAVQNLSRDYAIDKLVITVTYDTDLEKARKLIKRVGQQLMEDPELAPMIIEPLKMQAVVDFGTYGIQLKLKMTTMPGSQSAVRQKAYPLIKKVFDENGVEFAHPTVKVAEGEPKAGVAAVQQMTSAIAMPHAAPSR